LSIRARLPELLPKMPHVLVLGATGTLGSALCTHLLNAGHTVFGLARSPSKASGLLQSEIIPVLGSVELPQGITNALLDPAIPLPGIKTHSIAEVDYVFSRYLWRLRDPSTACHAA
jgi:nucleoside-diphosphate-sugar epimerase